MRVELRGVRKTFKDKIIVDIDYLSFESGRIYAVLGPNGCGKTTMLRIIAGLDRDFSGNVYYGGEVKKDRDLTAYMPQSSYLFDYTVFKNVMLGIADDRKIVDYRITDGGMKSGNCDIRIRAEQALASVGMSSFANMRAHSLSGGEAQRVALARTLVLGRSIVLLDEPASATDISGMELVEKYIKTVNKNDGSTIVFSTHNPSQAARIADEAIMMHCGRVLETGSPSELFESPKTQETRDFLRNWRI